MALAWVARAPLPLCSWGLMACQNEAAGRDDPRSGKQDRTVALLAGLVDFGAKSDASEVWMPRRNPFKGHRFPADVILLTVRWYCRFPLSYRDVRDLLEERGIIVDVTTIYRWVRKFGPEIAKRSFKHRNSRSLMWHVDETYLRIGGLLSAIVSIRDGSVCLNSFEPLRKWIFRSVMPPPGLVSTG